MALEATPALGTDTTKTDAGTAPLTDGLSPLQLDGYQLNKPSSGRDPRIIDGHEEFEKGRAEQEAKTAAEVKALLDQPGSAAALKWLEEQDKNYDVARYHPDAHDLPYWHNTKSVDSVPSDQKRADAEKTLEKGMSKLIPEADRAAMIAITSAITSGNSEAFAKAIKDAGKDPAKLKLLVDEVDKMLEAQHCTTRLDVTANGKVLISDTERGTALAFDPVTGNAEAKAVEQRADGSMLIKPEELLHVDKDKAFKEMGDRAVNGVNGDNIVQKPDDFEPLYPGWKIHPEPLIYSDPLPYGDPVWLKNYLKQFEEPQSPLEYPKMDNPALIKNFLRGYKDPSWEDLKIDDPHKPFNLADTNTMADK